MARGWFCILADCSWLARKKVPVHDFGLQFQMIYGVCLRMGFMRIVFVVLILPLYWFLPKLVLFYCLGLFIYFIDNQCFDFILLI